MAKAKKEYDYDSKFAVRLRELMTERKITQEELAPKLKVTRQSVSNYYNGLYPPSEKLIAIAKEFDVSTDYLLGLSDFKSVNADLQSAAAYLNINENTITNLKTILESHKKSYEEWDMGYWQDNLIALEFLFKSKIIPCICEHLVSAKTDMDIINVYKHLGKPYNEFKVEEDREYSEFLLHKSIIKEIEKIIVDMPQLYTVDDYNQAQSIYDEDGDIDG